MTETLYVVCTISNPLSWESRVRLAREVIPEWVRQGAAVYVVEVAHGSRRFDLADLPGIVHIPVRATTSPWQKESAWNIGLHRLPHDAQKVAFIDADIVFRDDAWVEKTLRALDLYPIVQPWRTCYDLGRGGSHGSVHTSFAYQYANGIPVTADGECGAWGQPYAYPHTGYGIAATRAFLDRVGGIFDLAALGSGDHHAFLGLVGKCEHGFPSTVSDGYKKAVREWSKRAQHHCNGRLGYVDTVIEHPYHGQKSKRGYLERWKLFIESEFDPYVHLKRNSFGLIEFAGNCPELERKFDQYLLSRDEDV